MNTTEEVIDLSTLEQFKHLLLPLDAQLERIRDHNQRFYGGRLADEQLGSVDTGTDHVQRVDDLAFLYVSFGSPQADLEAHWKVHEGVMPGKYRWPEIKTGPRKLRLGPYARSYAPGIYRLSINLVANWSPSNGRTVTEVRARTREPGVTLAFAETLAVYGLHTELFQCQDGVTLPYQDLAGGEATVPGIPKWEAVLYSDWGRLNRESWLSAHSAGYRNRDYGAAEVRDL